MRRPLVLVALAALCSCHDIDQYRPCPSGQVLVDGTCTVVPSCAGLPDSCGPDNESCCATARVQGDYFKRGFDLGVGPMSVLNAAPSTSTPVRVDSFLLDRYEITVGRFRAFVRAYDVFRNNGPHAGDGADPNRPAPMAPGGGPSGEVWNLSWNALVPKSAADMVAAIDGKCGQIGSSMGARGNWTDDPGAYEDRPMTCISWYEALMFCIWDQGRLPTEAEWNFAAAGGAEQRAYPWSNPPSDTSIMSGQANYQGGSPGTLTEVGSYPLGMGVFHQYDLAGNAYEWTMDCPQTLMSYDDESLNPLDTSGYSAPVCGGRVVRGGSYEFQPVFSRTSSRNTVQPDLRYNDVGARCARGRAALP